MSVKHKRVRYLELIRVVRQRLVSSLHRIELQYTLSRESLSVMDTIVSLFM